MKEKILQIIMVVVFVCGLLVFLYPKFTEWKAAYETVKTIEVFEQNLTEKKCEKENDSEIVENKQENQKKDNILVEALYKDMIEYNEQLYREGQSELKDPFDYENPSFDLLEYGFENNVIGTVQIEKINVKLPLYLGATTENMKKGGVILGETSMPVGGKNSNVVIAAHRGYQGIPMFREIEKIQIGDIIEITTVFETLTYQVTECSVILPNQVNEILIQEGEDMVTLLTCHPYTQNTHRYLVYAKRYQEQEKKQQPEQKKDTTQQEITAVSSEGNEENREIKENGERERTVSESHIWLETYVPIIGVGVIILMIVAGIIITGKRK